VSSVDTAARGRPATSIVTPTMSEPPMAALASSASSRTVSSKVISPTETRRSGAPTKTLEGVSSTNTRKAVVALALGESE
jgi:hypothetical protein